MWTERIHELENASMQCTNKAKNDAEMDGVEVINLCSVSHTKMRHIERERKAQSKIVTTKQNPTQRIELKMN